VGRSWDAKPSVARVTISVVLRLAPTALDAGRLAGEAELVATGERTTVRSAEELIRFVIGARDDVVQPEIEAMGVESDGRGG
jgi:hypothetical protein